MKAIENEKQYEAVVLIMRRLRTIRTASSLLTFPSLSQIMRISIIQ